MKYSSWSLCRCHCISLYVFSSLLSISIFCFGYSESNTLIINLSFVYFVLSLILNYKIVSMYILVDDNGLKKQELFGKDFYISYAEINHIELTKVELINFMNRKYVDCLLIEVKNNQSPLIVPLYWGTLDKDEMRNESLEIISFIKNQINMN